MDSSVQAKISHLPRSQKQTNLAGHVDPSRASTTEVVAMISLKAPLVKLKDTDREPVKIVAVIDVSKSMEDGKLDLVKASLSFILNQLSVKDSLGIVKFGSDVEKVLSMTKMDERGKHQARNVLNMVRESGSTNLSGGLLEGLTMIQKSIATSDIPQRHTLMLFTDGAANRGICEVSKLKRVASSFTKAQEDLYQIFAFGFGKDHDPTMLNAIKDVGGHGDYYYIENHESIGPYFAECLGGLLSLVAQNATITLSPQKGVKLCKVYGFENSFWEGKESPTLRLGDLYSEQQKDILCAMSVEPQELEKGTSLRDLLGCHVSFFDLIEQQITEREHMLSLPYSEEAITLNSVVCMHLHRVITAEAMYTALKLAETNLTLARLMITETIEFLENETVEGDDLTPFLIQDLDNMGSRQKYLTIGRGDLFSLSSSHANQRSTVYTTSLQSDMIEKMLDSEAYKNAASLASTASAAHSASAKWHKQNEISHLSASKRSIYYTTSFGVDESRK